MALIDEPDAARRLARAVCADIRLYNAEEIAKGGDLSSAIAEGRTFFAARVTPAHHGVFEEAVRELLAAEATDGGSPAPRRTRERRLDVALVLGVCALVVGVLLYLKFR